MNGPTKVCAAVLLAGSVLAATPALGAWRLVEAGESREVARGNLYVTPAEEWNRSTDRPARRGEVWTRDGLQLNDLGFYANIRDGEPLFRERDRRRAPLPKFDKDMLPTDIVEWFGQTANIVLGGSLFQTTTVQPATLGGFPGVHFGYTYTGGDNVARRGEVRAAIVEGRLYLITFDAPELHYFDRDIAGVRAIMDSARFRP